MYVDTAMHRPTVTHPDTWRDEKETARRAASPQRAGRFRRWWQVLGSNQRRLSRRFYSTLLPAPPYAISLHKRDRVMFAVATLSAICPCPRAPSRRTARTATDTVRATCLTCPDGTTAHRRGKCVAYGSACHTRPSTPNCTPA